MRVVAGQVPFCGVWVPSLLARAQDADQALCCVQCKGQATGFVASEYYKKLNICTGKFGMFAKAKKSEGKFVAGKFCAGKSLGAFFLGEEDKDSAMIAKAA